MAVQCLQEVIEILVPYITSPAGHNYQLPVHRLGIK